MGGLIKGYEREKWLGTAVLDYEIGKHFSVLRENLLRDRETAKRNKTRDATAAKAV
jgi:hypothetical protein